MPTSIDAPEVKSALQEALHAVQTRQIRTVQVGDARVKIPTPFPSPADWRDHWIYFLMVDRFNNPTAPPQHAPFDGEHGVFQGGTFNGIRQKLKYLRDLGVGAIWLSPVIKNVPSNPFTYHGYGFQDFLAVEPRFASSPQNAEQELRALVDEAHAVGLYVIFDVVLNHAGDVFEYILDGGTHVPSAPFRHPPYRIIWRDADGRGRPDWEEGPVNPSPDAAVWPRELQCNSLFRRQGRGGEDGGDFESLKEMVTRIPDVRRTLIQAYEYIIAKFDVDGFRIDTLKFIEEDFARTFGNAMREFALSIGKQNFFTFGEVFDNEAKIVRFIGRNTSTEDEAIGVDAVLDFPLFFQLPGVIKGLFGTPRNFRTDAIFCAWPANLPPSEPPVSWTPRSGRTSWMSAFMACIWNRATWASRTLTSTSRTTNTTPPCASITRGMWPVG